MVSPLILAAIAAAAQVPEPAASSAALLSGGPTMAAQEIPARQEEEALRTRDRPSGRLEVEDPGFIGHVLLDWGGARQQLMDAGFGVEVLYTTDGSWLASEGPSSDDLVVRGLLDWAVTYDTAPVLGHEGGLFHLGLQWINGVNASSRFGVLQPVSNIDADRRFQVGRVWYEQAFEASSTRVRIGKIDANSQFAYVERGAQFLHSSMGFSPTIFLMPSYPDAAFGATVVQVLGGFDLRVGAFDGAFADGTRTGANGPETLFDSTEDYFFIGEASAAWDSGRAAIGAWSSTARVARFDGGEENGTGGFHGVAEQDLWRSSGAQGGRLAAFLQLGWADPDVSPIEDHVGFGLAWDVPRSTFGSYAGLGVSRAGLSNEIGAAYSASTETAFELFWGFEPLPWVRVKPDLQLIVDPGGDASRDDAWILSMRVTLAI